jgi:hypothetical protein
MAYELANAGKKGRGLLPALRASVKANAQRIRFEVSSSGDSAVAE